MNLVGLQPGRLDHYFLECFDTDGWPFWPIKTRPDIQHNTILKLLGVRYSYKKNCPLAYYRVQRIA